MKFRLWLEADSTIKSLRRKMVSVVRSYLGITPNVQSFEAAPFDSSIFGKIGGVTDDAGNVQVNPESLMSSLHEIIHTAGFMPVGVGEVINEGIVQALAEDIATSVGLNIPKTYSQEVRDVNEFLIPATGLGRRDFFRQYARATDKGRFLTDVIWNRNAHLFSNTEDWGPNAKLGLEQALRQGISIRNFYLDAIAGL